MSKLRVYARYPKGCAESSEERSLEAYAGLDPMGVISYTEHIAYSRSMLPEHRLAVGDQVLQIGTLRLRDVVLANYTGRLLPKDIRLANTMVIKKRYTGQIYKVEIAHRLDGPPRPYVVVHIAMRRFRKKNPAMRAHAE
ncbi:uncharacterized protein LOC118517400 [Anopheles stephensi]|uniref:uncharacterized protein LOC118517400 n=1 Tax=Anopheles stephensi TaxID=30069 RepID=UPI00165887A8|nr:uncharacterized protein LOC118517400 [Anopheles stephensi]